MKILIKILIASVICHLPVRQAGLSSACFSQVNSDSLISVYTKKMQKYLDKDGKVSEIFSFTKEGIEVYIPATDTSQKKIEYIVYWDSYWKDKMDSSTDAIQFTNHPNKYIDWESFYKNCKAEYYNRTTASEIKMIYPVVYRSIIYSNTADGGHYGKLLEGYKICLDPGHIGGDIEIAKKEKKWVEMKANPSKGIKEPIQLIEGNLTCATAKILKKKLESQGAKVMLTRQESGISSFGISYEKWKDSLFLRSVDSAYARGDISFEEKNFLLLKANDTEIFRRFFLQEEMRERARRINNFSPDLTLIIHYNVDETNVNWNKPTKKNYNMAFVGGSFGADELERSEARINFLRLLLTDNIENSIEFSKYVVENLVEKTKVPAALDSCALYLKGNCITTDAPGVFCRNLALTRMVKGTLCYGESLYQDNINECKALSKNEITVNGMKTSKRVEEVAEAYFFGIMNYVKSKYPDTNGGKDK